MSITGTVPITSNLAPTATTDTFGTHDQQWGIGGAQQTATHTTRNAIPTGRRRLGMLVWVDADSSYWYLNTATNTGTDADWTAYSTGGGGTPGGSTTQLQYNNAGSFGGTTTTYNSGTGAISLAGALNENATVTIASAASVAIGAATANAILISGTTAITSFDTIAAGVRRVVRFAGILTLTYNATSLILPSSASITTAANDTAEFISLGSGNWFCNWYERASGSALVSGGGLTKWTEAVDTSFTVATTSFTPVNTNSNVALIPTGNGGLVMQVPNGGFAGGDPRGTKAIDMQMSRGSSSQVAAAARSSTIGGASNTVVSTASDSGCFTGNSNTVSGSGNAGCFAGGSNIASNSGAVALGGSAVTASGTNAVATGQSGNASGTNSSGFGNGYSARSITGAMVHTSSQSGGSGGGKEQGIHLTLRGTTTDAVTILKPTSDGAAASATNQWKLVSNSGLVVECKVVARNTSTQNLAWWVISAGCKNVAGTTSLSGAVNGGGAAINGDAAMSTCTATVVADNTNGCLQFNCTGIAATTINWTVEGWSCENTA